MEMKLCAKCGIEKPLSEYHVRRRNRTRNGQPFVYVHVPGECSRCEHDQRRTYGRTEAGKATRRRMYEKQREDPHWQEWYQNYWNSEQGRLVQQRFRESPQGKVLQTYWNAQQRIEDELERSLTGAEWAEILDAYGSSCAYCRRSLNRETLTLDHIKPISEGGQHHRENVVPSCERCNLKKATKRRVPRPPLRPIRFD